MSPSTVATSPDVGAGLGPALAAALRYVAAWRGQVVVVKCGGSVLDDGAWGTLAEDLALLQRAGVRPVLVHGGGPAIDRALRARGVAPRFVDGLRVTDEATMAVVEAVLAGEVNVQLVATLQAAGAAAVGVTGRDGGLLRVRPRAPELGFVGEVERVDPALLQHLVAGGWLPVVAPLGIGPEGASYNLNADTAAAALAVALGAAKLVVLTDVPGVLVDGARVSELTPAEAEVLIQRGVVRGGMVPKLRACLRAVGGGVASAHVVGAAEPHALLVELLTEGGVGTWIRSA